MTQTEQQLQDFLSGAGQNVVGAVVMWALSGARVPRAELRERMEAIGLGRAVPRDPRPERVLAKAVQACQAGHKGLIFRRTSKREWAIVQEAERAEGSGVRLILSHVLTIGVEQAEQPDGTKDWVPTVTPQGLPRHRLYSEADALARRVCDAYTEAAQYANTDDLSITLTSAMGGSDVDAMLGAVNLRQGTGGVYYVPGCNVERVQQLKALVADLQGESRLTVLTLYGDKENLEEAARAARASFQAKLNELRGELGDFVKEMQQGEKTMTDRHVQTRVKRLGTLQERVAMWTDALGDVQAELMGRIEAAKAEVATAMGL